MITEHFSLSLKLLLAEATFLLILQKPLRLAKPMILKQLDYTAGSLHLAFLLLLKKVVGFSENGLILKLFPRKFAGLAKIILKQLLHPASSLIMPLFFISQKKKVELSDNWILMIMKQLLHTAKSLTVPLFLIILKKVGLSDGWILKLVPKKFVGLANYLGKVLQLLPTLLLADPLTLKNLLQLAPSLVLHLIVTLLIVAVLSNFSRDPRLLQMRIISLSSALW